MNFSPEALEALRKLARKGPSNLPDLDQYVDLWTHKLVSGSHARVEITDAGRDYLKKHF